MRKRKAQPEALLQQQLDWFTRLAGECEQKNKKQVQSASTGGAFYTLRSVLATNQIDTTQPIAKIVYELQTQHAGLESNFPVVRLFLLQWAEFTKALYAGSHYEAQQRKAVEPRWFDDRVAQITFKTVFANGLWEKAGRNTTMAQFDTLSDTASVVRRRPEELLQVSDCFQGDGKVQCNMIMEHVGHHLAKAKAGVYLDRLVEWDRKVLVPLQTRLAEFPPITNPDQLLPPSNARFRFREDVTARMESIDQLHEEDIPAAIGEALPKAGKDMVAKHSADLAAKKEAFKQKIENHIMWRLMIGWCDQVRRHWTLREEYSAVSVRAILDDIDSNRVTSGKRVRLLLPADEAAPEQKVVVGPDLLSQISAALKAANDHGDLDAFLGSTLKGTVVRMLQERADADRAAMETIDVQTNRAAGDVKMEMAALEEAARMVDVGAFMQELAERAKLSRTILKQQQNPPTAELDALLNGYIPDRIRAATDRLAGAKQGYLEIHKVVLAHFVSRVADPLRAKITTVRMQLDERRRQVIAAEPWFDTAIISSEMQKEISELTNDKQPVTTVSNALNRATKWFEVSLSMDL
jgi:hypothetical protein